MFNETALKTFYIRESLDYPLKATVIFQGPKNGLYDIFIKHQIKPTVEAFGHIYESTKTSCWIC